MAFSSDNINPEIFKKKKSREEEENYQNQWIFSAEGEETQHILCCLPLTYGAARQVDAE